MHASSAQKIERWFAQHHGDGDFAAEPRGVPYQIVGPASSATKVIYTTKPRLISHAIEVSDAPPRYGMVGRYGLPCKSDLVWISRIADRNPLQFFGDLDVVDLLVFCWLRLSLGEKRIKYYGIGDKLLTRMRIPIKVLSQIANGRSERLAIPLLEAEFPDNSTVVGPRCSSILKRQHKVEMEALVAALGSLDALKLPTL